MEKLCFGCMRMKRSSPVCEHCGFDENAENLPHQLPIGTLLQNQYLVGRVLGQGGFGITYMGWDQHLSVPVAIKEYFPSGTVQRHTKISTEVTCTNDDSPEEFSKHRTRFLQEARILAQLSDIPGIVRVRNYFSENETAYIVMEYVQGMTLKQYLKNLGRPMTEAEALEIMAPVLKALQKVHENGLIHRDISPDNIMIPPDGDIKLIDFGTVRFLNRSDASKSTESVLKPGFAPMEQYNTRGNLGSWTDVYAVSATFHYLLTGRVPSEAMARIEQGETLPILRGNSTLSEKLIRSLEHGMRLKVGTRLQTVKELYELLYTDAMPEPIAKEPFVPRKETISSPAPEKKSSGKWIAAIAAAVLALAAGALLLLPRQNSPAAAEPEGMPVQVAAPSRQTIPTPGTAEEAAALYQQALDWEAEGSYGKAAIAFAKLGDYQDSRERSFLLWAKVPNRKTFSFYDYFNTAEGRYVEMIHAIRKDGSVMADTTFSDSLSADVLAQYATGAYREIVSIHGIIGLRFDGTLALPEDIQKYEPLAGWTDITALAVSEAQSESANASLYVGLRADGTVVAAGSSVIRNWSLDHWTDIVAIACSSDALVGLKSDGTVICAGLNSEVEKTLQTWKNIRSIALCGGHVFALTADGILINTENDHLESGITALVEGPYAIRNNGTVLAVTDEKGNVSNWTNIVGITGSSWQTAGLKEDGTIVFTADGYGFYANAKNWTKLLLPGQVIADPQVVYAQAESFLANSQLSQAAITFGSLEDYRDASRRSMELWQTIYRPTTVSAGYGCVAAIKVDGTVISPAIRDNRQYSVSGWRKVVSIHCGTSHTVGLCADGTVLSAGSPDNGLRNAASWRNITAVAVSADNTLGLTADGKVLAVGANNYGQCSVTDWQDIAAIASASHSVGLKTDGTVVAAGSNQNGQCNVSHWQNITAVRCASYQATGITAGLTVDGTVVLAGAYPELQNIVSRWQDIVALEVAVDQNSAFVAGLKADGTLVIASTRDDLVREVSGWHNIVAISANHSYLIALQSDGTPLCAGRAINGEFAVTHTTGIRIPK